VNTLQQNVSVLSVNCFEPLLPGGREYNKYPNSTKKNNSCTEKQNLADRGKEILLKIFHQFSYKN
jgi:hypothetical protein